MTDKRSRTRQPSVGRRPVITDATMVAVVSLSDAEERRRLLWQMGFPRSWVDNYWPGTDYRTKSIVDIKSDPLYERLCGTYGREILPGELGCLYAHLSVIKFFEQQADEAQLLVVFEDDVRPMVKDVSEMVGLLSEAILKLNLNDIPFVCHLGPLPGQIKSAVSSPVRLRGFEDSGFKIYEHRDSNQFLWRAHAYMLNRAAAKKYSQYQEDWRFLADDWIRITSGCGLKLLYVCPRMFVQSDSLPSYIDNGNRRQVGSEKKNNKSGASMTRRLCTWLKNPRLRKER